MKKKIIWLVVSCLMALSLVMASCGPAAEEEEEEEEEEEAVEEEAVEEEEVTGWVAPAEWGLPAGTTFRDPSEPKYGGTFVGHFYVEPSTMDDNYITCAGSYSQHFTNDELLTGDWSKSTAYGGTGERDWWTYSYFWEDMVGRVATSFTIPDANTIIWQIRPGILFHDKYPAFGRELTAEDVGWSIYRAFTEPQSINAKNAPGWMQSYEVVDEWTLIFHVQDSELARTGYAFEAMADLTKINCPEAVEEFGDLRDWRNAIGTGPFILTDVVPGAVYTYVKHPDYFMKDPIYPENQLPYLDGMQWIVIKDESTRLAALRTGKIDYAYKVGWEDGVAMGQTNPELQFKKGLGSGTGVYLRTDRPPFDDIRVRRALNIAIDKQEVLDMLYGGMGTIIANPIAPEPIFKTRGWYPELEELTEWGRKVWKYDVDLAKQLLAEAGYPDGFDTSVDCYRAEEVDVLSIIAHYWEAIGVDLEIRQSEYAVWLKMRYASSQEHAIVSGTYGVIPRRMLSYHPAKPWYNLSLIDSERMNEIYSEVWAFDNLFDYDLIAQLMEEHMILALDQAWLIDMPTPMTYTMWQPWVQNYQGEYSVGSYSQYNWARHIWLDTEIKEAMGY